MLLSGPHPIESVEDLRQHIDTTYIGPGLTLPRIDTTVWDRWPGVGDASETQRDAQNPSATHGCLAYSLIPHMLSLMYDLAPLSQVRTVTNFGADNLRHSSPVHEGQTVRLESTILEVSRRPGSPHTTVKIDCTLMVDDAEQPACTGVIILHVTPKGD